MKYRISLLVLCILIAGACTQVKKHSTSDINGNWDYIGNSPVNDYTISLKLENDKLQGIHCFIAQSGNKIDCADDDIVTIECFKNTDSYKGTFFSTYSNDKYNLTVKISADTLYWNLDNNSQLFFRSDLKFVKRKE